MKLNLERDFAENTSLHGISRIYQSAGWISKVVWSLIFVFSFGLFIWQFTERIVIYLEYNVNTRIEVLHDGYVVFPAVTLCNYNRFWKDRLTNEDLRYVEALLKITDVVDDYFYDSQQTNTSLLDGDGNETYDFRAFLSRTGFRLNDSLIQCEWKGKKDSCSAANFTPVFIQEYGICYQFGPKSIEVGPNSIELTDELLQDLPGSGNGLSVLMDIQQNMYTEHLEGHQEAAVKFVIHNIIDPPLVDALGFSAPPGYHTYAAVSKSIFEGLSEPWGKCREFNEDNTLYSREQCLRSCRTQFIVDECQCQPLDDTGMTDDDVPICTPDMAKCVGKALQTYRTIRVCVCPLACQEVTYKSTLSMALFPGAKVLQDYAKKLREKSDEEQSSDYDYTVNMTHDDIASHIRNNWVYLDIYFDELSVTKFKQVKAMTVSDLLSDLGGQMGLFLGMSAITAAEVLEYLIRKIHHLCGGGRSDNMVREINI